MLRSAVDDWALTARECQPRDARATGPDRNANRQRPTVNAFQMPDSIVIALSTCPNDAAARRIAQTLVTEGLAACVNRIGSVTSTYLWDGEMQEEGEILLMMKTTAGRLAELEARLKAIHPYELPELIAIPVTGGNERYLDWVRLSVANKDQAK